jgi:hypothetical protein
VGIGRSAEAEPIGLYIVGVGRFAGAVGVGGLAGACGAGGGTVGAGRFAGAGGVGEGAVGARRSAGAEPIGLYTTGAGTGEGGGCGLASSASARLPPCSSPRLKAARTTFRRNGVRLRLVMRRAYRGLARFACCKPFQAGDSRIRPFSRIS